MVEPWQHFYQSQRLRLSYWTWGDASKAPLVLIHGGRDHARNWDRVAEAFCDDYHVIACDLRGHGDSQWAHGGMYGLIEHIPDITALIDLVGGRAHVIGHSFGGALSLLVAGAFPDRVEKLVVIEGAGARLDEIAAVPLTPERIREWTVRTRAMEQQSHRVYPSFEAAAERMLEANPHLTEEMTAHLARWGTHGIDGGYVWKFDPWVRGRVPGEIQPEEMQAFWSAIQCPILHLIGAESTYRREQVRGKTLDEYFQDSRTLVVEQSGHWVHHDQFDIAVNTIREFFGPPPPPQPLD